MIRVTSSYPFQNLLRVTQEFHEEKAQVKIKSLSVERVFEFAYSDVREISDSFSAQAGQITFTFWALFGLSLVIVFACRFIYAHPFLWRLWQIAYVTAWCLFLAGFRRNWIIYFSDANDRILTHIKQTSKNGPLIPQIVDLIRKNNVGLHEISAADPFPDVTPKFEHVQSNILEMHKITDRFYEDEIIGFQKGIYGDEVYNIKYSQLNGQIFHGKKSEDLLGFLLTISGLIMSIFIGLSYGFDIGIEKTVFRVMAYSLGAIFILSLLAGFLGYLIKREIIGFHKKDGSIIYWTYVNRTNRAQMDEIIRFVQSRISQEEKNQLLKEQT